jgi:hypothetical protein
MVSSAERRRSRRVLTPSRCWISDSCHVLYTPICNISREGLSISGITPFKPGQEVSIKIEGYPSGNDLIARSRVVWARGEEEPSQMGMGAEFLEIIAGAYLLDQLTAER